jgi:site-specific DNA recombinase
VKVVGYVRVSTQGQADSGLSIEAQRTKLAAYATAMDLELIEIIEDAGVSAKSLDRPGMKKLLGMLDAGEIAGVLTAKLDRVTRRVADLGFLVERYFASGNFALLSVSDSIDTRTASGRLVLNVLVSVAQWEREACAERTREALAQLRASGVPVGPAPFGSVHAADEDAHGRRIIREVTAEGETIGRIQGLRDEGRSLREICSALTSAGAPTKRGGRWSPKVVRSILKRKASR